MIVLIIIQIMMRKYPNKQLSKRQWKTPSPSSHTQLRSPRLNLQLRQSPKQENSKLSINQKSKPSLLAFKNNLLQQKYETTRPIHQKHENEPILTSQFQSQIKFKTINDEAESYNSYFSKVSSVYSNIIRNSSQSAKNLAGHVRSGSNSNGKQVRETGFKINESEAVTSSNTMIEEKLKKYVQQMAKLKNNYKDLEADYEKLKQYCRKIECQLQVNQNQISSLKKKIEDKKQVENSLNEQIKKLNDRIQISTTQLNNSNLQIYKMKQELYQVSLQNKKLYKKTCQSSVSPFKKTNTVSPLPSVIQSSLELNQDCENCRISRKLIGALNNAIENKMLQVSKKDTIIQNICNDLQKVELELKMFQKPKLYIKKMAYMLQLNNDEIMRAKIRQMNEKYASS